MENVMNRLDAWRIGLLLLAVGIVFGQVWTFAFVTWDDPMYVVANPNVLSGLSPRGIAWAFTTRYFGLWSPLTWISHMTDVSMWGMFAGGHHLTSVMLHGLAAVMLYLFLREATQSPWRSFLVALLFAVHPLRAESVAWVAERKDVLVAVFYFGCLLLYVKWARTGQMGYWIAAIIAAILGGLSKPMVVSLPAVMVLLDFWPLKRYSISDQSLRSSCLRAVAEKWVYLIGAVALSLLTISEAQETGVRLTTAEDAIPFLDRLQIASVAYGMYIWKTLLPIRQSFYHTLYLPFPWWQVALFPLGFFSGLFLAWRWRESRPYVLVGLLWYFVVLLPVSGIVSISFYAYADRYSYLPQVGLLIALVWSLPESFFVGSRRWVGTTLVGATVALSMGVAFWQVGYWRNSETLYSRAIELDPNNRVAHIGLGHLYRTEHQNFPLAIHHYEAVILDNNRGNMAAQAYAGVGDIAFHQSRVEDAQRAWLGAIQADGVFFRPRLRLGTLALLQGHPDEAVDHLTVAERLMPGHAEVLNNLGVAYARLGNHAMAAETYGRAVKGNPRDRIAHLNLARTHEKLGNIGLAVRQYEDMLRLFPGDADAIAGLSRLRIAAAQ